MFVLEFKVGAESYDLHSVVQTRTYAFDLANFHEESHNREIIPILIATGAESRSCVYQKYNKNIYDVIFSNGDNLYSIISHFCQKSDLQINLDNLITSRYVPTGITLENAKEKVKSFIQIIHHFRDNALSEMTTPPVDNVVIFDEAQRAWNAPRLSKFMKEKKNKIRHSFDDWNIFVSNKINEKVSSFVQHLLDNDKDEAAELYQCIKDVYPIYMTRNLDSAKKWIKQQTTDKNRRYGLIASSKGKRTI